MRVLMNAYRLAAGDEGAGGAGRHVLSLIREISRHIELRVLCSPDNVTMIEGVGSEARLVTVFREHSDLYAAHLEW